MNTRDKEFIDMSTDELEERRNEVMAEIAGIKAQIEGAKNRALQDGVYADADWFTRVRHALRYRGIEHQKLNTEIARRSKEAKAKRAALYERAFVESARIILAAETFSQLHAAAMERSR